MGRRGSNEGSIYQRPDGTWVAALHNGYDINGKRVRKYVTGKTRSRVSAKLTDLLKNRKDGLPTPGASLTVGTFLQRWLCEVAEERLRPRTFASYKMIVERHLKPAIGRVSLMRLNPDQVQGYMREKKSAGLSARTVQYHHAVLRTALAQAESWGLVQRNVARLAKPGKVERPEIRPLTPAQTRTLLAGIAEDRLVTLYSLEFTLGLRQGELLGLTWEDVDLTFCTLTVRHTLQRYDRTYHLDPPKTARSRRELPLTPSLTQQLRAHLARQQQEHMWAGPEWKGDQWNLIFCNELGQPLSGTSLTHQFQKLLEVTGLPRQRFHDARHAAGMYLRSQGADLQVLMEVLGHASITTTANIYGHVVKEQQRSALERVDSLLAPET